MKKIVREFLMATKGYDINSEEVTLHDTRNLFIERFEQMNPYYDRSKSNNGGGYDQPHVTGYFKNSLGNIYKFELVDNSCGDFGADVDVYLHGYKGIISASYGLLAEERGYETMSSFDVKNRNHMEFLNALEQWGYHVPTKQDF